MLRKFCPRYFELVAHIKCKDLRIFGVEHSKLSGPGSGEEAASVVNRIRPRQVFVELDEDRFKSTIQAIKSGKSMTGPSRSDIVGTVHGGLLGRELRGVVEAARSVGSAIYLIDRPHRIASKILNPVVFKNFLNYAAKSLNVSNSVNRSNQLEPENNMSQLSEELSKQCPSLYRVMIAEREEFMATQIDSQLINGESALVICGSLHAKGLKNILEDPSKMAQIDLSEITRKGLSLWPLVVFLYLLLPLGIIASIWLSLVRGILGVLRKALGIPDQKDVERGRKRAMLLDEKTQT